MKHIKYLFLILTFSTFTNCKVQYSFTPPTSIIAETFQVDRFENTSLLFEPGLDLLFQNTLQDLIQNQTNYRLEPSGADLIYEGEITDYRIAPTTATAQNTAAQNRLTITVKVRFYNTNNEEDDLDQSFSFFYDFPGSSQLVGAQKETAHEEILDRLTQDIFNATLARW
ncbi:LPS assembly lipoprotein LptE [Seonamhaeicola sp.]|uniref:LPS assembly lipoprotein LptE n=1 Tax=Seonamhaeicola sp. TaxID=1912245 RepID=UPI0026123514|nr:LPS assembly lipoprotein LptE [Seonamhaeicola sp.]